MTFAEIPWLELTIAIPLFGGIGVSFMRDRLSASRWCLGLTGVAFVFAVIVWLGVEAGFAPTGSLSRDLLSRALGRPVLAIDSLSAPLLPLVALLHFLTALATARIKSTRYSFTWLLLAEALWLATFACVHPWVLGCLLALSTFPPYLELLRCGRPTRVYILHMAVFLGLLFAGLLLGGRGRAGDCLRSAHVGRAGANRHISDSRLGDGPVRELLLRHGSADRHADRGGVRGDSSRCPIGALTGCSRAPARSLS